MGEEASKAAGGVVGVGVGGGGGGGAAQHCGQDQSVGGQA